MKIRTFMALSGAKIKRIFTLPKAYLYGAMVPLFVNAFLPNVSYQLWLSGCYLVLGAVILIIKKR